MIVPMKKLTLAALLEHREAILQALQSICAVQLISIGEGEQPSAAAEGCSPSPMEMSCTAQIDWRACNMASRCSRRAARVNFFIGTIMP